MMSGVHLGGKVQVKSRERKGRRERKKFHVRKDIGRDASWDKDIKKSFYHIEKNLKKSFYHIEKDIPVQ